MHIGECTDYFEYDHLDVIISQLDNRKQMELFVSAASDEYYYYYNCVGEIFNKICYDNPYGSPIPKHGDNIIPILEEMMGRAISRKELDAKYNTPCLILTKEDTNKPIPTPTEWIETSNNVLSLMRNSDIQIEEWIKQIESVSKQGVEQLKLLKDKSLTTLMAQYNDLNTKYETTKKELQKYEKWFEKWQKLKEEIASECYDRQEIEEAGGIDDPSVMYDAINSIVTGNQIEKQLKEENEKLREQQDAWRERPEYKAEIAKLESKTKKQVSVEKIREGILAHLDGYGNISELDNFLLRINRMLRNTAWDAVADNVEHEAKEVFKNNEISHSKQKTKELQDSINEVVKQPKIGSLILEQNNGTDFLEAQKKTTNSNLLN